MDPKLEKSIIEDLYRFLGTKKFYKKVGKVWKRGDEAIFPGSHMLKVGEAK